ncbi:MAG: hypothetical protein M1825_003232 [Sarcosagium campestre]|nr:MAG: hypothetical protein M1825_003232 [Sarcosagium campestre]
MDTSYLTSQVANIIGQLHGLFDDIGVPNQERDSRESELFTALSETLHNQLRQVTAEKKELTEEAHQIITTIKQMEASLEDNNSSNGRYQVGSEGLKVTFPLSRCLQTLKEKHNTISRLHRERFEQVKKLVQALQSYSSHLEPSFIQVTLPPTTDAMTLSPTFNLSPSYLSSLDKEFNRIYEEYTRRCSHVTQISEEIITLWAELGIPQAQTDTTIVQNHRDSPEQIGLHKEDLQRLKEKKEKLVEEKRGREVRLKDLRVTVEGLWDRLSIEEHERKRFLNGNRGCGIRQINEFEDELARLNELKRQNLHLFVEDARCRLQDLWDALYFSEEDMLEFTPAFSDVYSDALLSAHEGEITRLETLRDQRAPVLQLIDKHRSLMDDRNALAQSSQDASRLMARGQRGEKRDPTRLLREEKMRKRITKELPKIEADLRKVLEDWEADYGRPFCVRGQRYIDELDACAARAPPPRSKTPSAMAPPASKPSKLAPATQPRNTAGDSGLNGSTTRGGIRPMSRAGAKTPTTGSIRGNPLANSTTSTKLPTAGGRSPSRIPARAPLSNMPHGNNSPERRAAKPAYDANPARKMGPPAMAPPPRMRDLHAPPPSAGTDSSDGTRCPSVASSNTEVRHYPPEDVYDDRSTASYMQSSSTMMMMPQSRQPTPQQQTYRDERPQQHRGYPNSATVHAPLATSISSSSHYPAHHHGSISSASSVASNYEASIASSRQISATSNSTHATTACGSENWETYDDVSEPEADASEAYYAKVRSAAAAANAAVPGKRFVPDTGYAPHPGTPEKKIKRIAPPGGTPAPGQHGGIVMMDGGGGSTSADYYSHQHHAGPRMVPAAAAAHHAGGGSEAGWTDEDIF